MPRATPVSGGVRVPGTFGVPANAITILSAFTRSELMNVILVGTDAALLEGLAQSYASSGFSPHVVATLMDACEVAAESAPIVAVVSRDLAVASAGDAMAIQLAPGGSLVLYHAGDSAGATPALLARSVVAELVLPLERSRLVALTKSLAGRAQVVGRTKSRTVEERAELL